MAGLKAAPHIASQFLRLKLPAHVAESTYCTASPRPIPRLSSHFGNGTRCPAPCTNGAHAGLGPDGGAARHRVGRRCRRSRLELRTSCARDGRTAGHGRPREPRPREGRDPQLGVRVSTGTHHRESRTRRRAKGRRGVRPPDCPRRAGGQRSRDEPDGAQCARHRRALARRFDAPDTRRPADRGRRQARWLSRAAAAVGQRRRGQPRDRPRGAASRHPA